MAMADAVISTLVDQLVSRSLQKIEEEVRLVKDVKKDVAKLKKNLGLIQALLEDAGKQQVNSRPISDWLSDLEDMSYDMDNVLDEWNTAILRSEIDQGEEGGLDESDRVVAPKKVCLPFPTACFSCSKQVKQVISHRDFAKRIKALNEELDRTTERGLKLGILAGAIQQSQRQQNPSTSSSKSKRATTTSLVVKTQIQGRDEDRNKVVAMLLCDSSSKGKEFDFMSIVGMGGLGKTALAQLVYNDDQVTAHFPNRIWVCVQELSSAAKISAAIIKELGGNVGSHEHLDSLFKELSKCIKGKKFLLVLDDVWTENRQVLEQLSIPFQDRGLGSKILVTTREEEVARRMRIAKERRHTLKGLSDEQCWSIIKQAASYVEGENDAELEATGLTIAKNCAGLPLVAKILGGLMLDKPRKQWKTIADKQLWNPNDSEGIFALFWSSYYELSPLEKCCFSYCAIFPKDYRIKIDMLIEMWMSQGYFSDSTEGLECFERLAMRSFFQDFEKDEDGDSISACKMHDLLHDFALILKKKECIIVEGHSIIEEKRESLDDKARHLTIVVESSSQQLPEFKEFNSTMQVGKRLRTLLVDLPYAFDDKFGLQSNLNLSGLRTLSMQRSNETMIKKLSNFIMLIHLRYLNLSYNSNLEELPESVCDLSNLQTLKLNWCSTLNRLPEGIGKLVSLRHLYIYGCWRLKWLPKGLGKLTTLQKLDMLVVPNNRDEYFNTEYLKRLKCLQLQRLRCIRQCVNLRNAGEAEEINLTNTEDLLHLKLHFNNDSISGEQVQNGRCEHEAMILEAFKPHPSLKSLMIREYNGITLSPSWMTSLTSLRSLCLVFCDNCEILPPLGKLPSLESLKIFGMRRVKKVGVEFLGVRDGRESEEKDGLAFQSPFISFPRLKHLSFVGMGEWKEWEGIQGQAMGSSIEVMPSLRSLELSYCRQLEAPPDFLRMTPLHTLKFDDCYILKEWLELCDHIPNIEMGYEYVKRDGEWNLKISNDDVPESSGIVAE